MPVLWLWIMFENLNPNQHNSNQPARDTRNYILENSRSLRWAHMTLQFLPLDSLHLFTCINYLHSFSSWHKSVREKTMMARLEVRDGLFLGGYWPRKQPRMTIKLHQIAIWNHIWISKSPQLIHAYTNAGLQLKLLKQLTNRTTQQTVASPKSLWSSGQPPALVGDFIPFKQMWVNQPTLCPFVCGTPNQPSQIFCKKTNDNICQSNCQQS